jgi:hypothetical protein
MNNAKHTPGPWLTGVNTSQIASHAGERFLGVGTDAAGRTICRISRLSTLDGEDEANAALIAAAPVLLTEHEVTAELCEQTAALLRAGLLPVTCEGQAKLLEAIAARARAVIAQAMEVV